MAYANGWKDGMSSADHPIENFSPYHNERDRRERMAASSERDRIMSEYEAGIEKEKRNIEKIQAEQAREEWINSERERKSMQRSEERYEAIDIIVEQKKQAYNKKSWFGKAIAKLRGKNFDKMRNQITEEAERMIDDMSHDEVKTFIELYGEGKTR